MKRQEVSSNPPSSWSLSVWSLYVLHGYSSFIAQPKGMQSLRLCVNFSMNGCLSLCVGPVTDWLPAPCLLPCDSWNRLQLPEIEWLSGRKSMDKGINKEIPDFADSQWLSQTMTPGKGREMLGDDQQNNHTSHSSLIPCSFHWWPQLDKDGTPCNDDVQSDITAGCVYRCSSVPLTILHLQPSPSVF